MSLTLEALQIVDTIARRGSFAAAAAELGKVPSALTYSVRKLEDDLDVLLFDRGGRHATLTLAGRELLEQGRHLLRAADDLACRVKRVASGWEVELRLAVDALVPFDRLRPLLDDFYREEMPTRLRLSYEVLDGSWDALVADRADLAIGAPQGTPHAMLAPGTYGTGPLGSVPFVFCVAPHHPLAAAEEPLSPDTLLRHRAVVLGDTSHGVSARSVGLLSGQDLLTVATLEQKIAAQVSGLGCGWLPEPFARPWLDTGRLVERQVAEGRASGDIVYAWRKAGTGNAMRWWLGKLALPVVRQQLVAGPLRAERS